MKWIENIIGTTLCLAAATFGWSIGQPPEIDAYFLAEEPMVADVAPWTEIETDGETRTWLEFHQELEDECDRPCWPGRTAWDCCYMIVEDRTDPFDMSIFPQSDTVAMNINN